MAPPCNGFINNQPLLILWQNLVGVEVEVVEVSIAHLMAELQWETPIIQVSNLLPPTTSSRIPVDLIRESPIRRVGK